jgi:hypothetical protein
MFAVNQSKVDKSAGRRLKELCGPILGQLAVMSDRLCLTNLVRCLQDEAQRNATLRELNSLNDRYFDDIGCRRPLYPKTDDSWICLTTTGRPFW